MKRYFLEFDVKFPENVRNLQVTTTIFPENMKRLIAAVVGMEIP